MKYIALVLLLCGYLNCLTQDETDLLNLFRKSTQDTELIKKIDELLNKDKKHFKISTYVKKASIFLSSL